MRDDVLSCARAGSCGDLVASVSAAVPTVIPVGSLVAKPDGISTNRSVGVDNGVRERTTHSSPDGHRRIFPQPLLGADPRAASDQPVPRPAPLRAAVPLARLGSVPRPRPAPLPAVLRLSFGNYPWPRPVPLPGAVVPAADTGNTAADGTPAHAESYATPDGHANAANGLPHPHIPDRNTAPGHIPAQRTLRSL
jgi:hypothetical protein